MSKFLVLALAVLALSAHAETKVNFSGDAYVRGYFLNGTSPYKTQAFNHFFRLNIDAKPEDNLTLKTGLVLAAETWQGDTHTALPTAGGTAIGGTNENDPLAAGNGNVTHLDHAVIEYKKDSWIYSAGRHAVTTPGCFLTCDDRRDRVQVVKFTPTYDVVAFAYDKRTEGSLTSNKDDLDMVTLAYYGAASAFKYALQAGYFKQPNKGSLNRVKQFTPQLTGNLFGIDYNLYYSILWGGSTLYKNDHHSAALRLTKDLEVVKVDYESTVTKRGGLVVAGFDTLSSIINNSPDHNQSSIKLRTIGYGLGVTKKDEYVHMVKFTKSFTQEFSASLGGGRAHILAAAGNSTIEKNSILDATAKYAFSKNLNLAGAYGKFFGDNKDHAGSLTLNATF